MNPTKYQLNPPRSRPCPAAIWLLLAIWTFVVAGTAHAQNEPLTIRCPADIVAWTCDDEGTDVEYPLPQVSGGCSNVTVVCQPPSGTVFPLGQTVVECVAVDDCGATARCEFTVIVRFDDEPPTIRCPEDLTVHACENNTGRCGAFVNYPAPIVADNSGEVIWTCTPPSGSFFPCGSHVVTCEARDRCGNTARCEFTVNVLDEGRPPTIECPKDLTLYTCSNSVAINYPAPLVNPADAVVTCTPPPGTILPLGVHTILCTAKNECGESECTFDIVVRPLPPPSINCLTNPIVVSAPCGSNCVPAVYPPPTVSNGTLVSCLPPSGFCFPLGETIVTCVASNDCGTARCEFTVRVVPGQGVPPRIICPSNHVAWTCEPNGGVVNYPPPQVFPGTDPNPTVVCVPPSGSVFPLGTTTVTCTVKDECGNEARCQFDVTLLRDVRPPEIHCPSNIVVCTREDVEVVEYNVSATDDCDPAPTITCVPPSGSAFPLGNTVVRCRAVDECGNESKCEFVVTVLKDEQPTLTIAKDPNSDDHLIICWPKTCRCFKLQATRSLNPPVHWVDVPNPPTDLGSRWCVRVPNDSRMRFFRLVACDQPVAPVYGVVSSGISAEQASILARALNIPPDQMATENGAALFLDPQGFQAVPTLPIQDPEILKQLAGEGENDEGEVVVEGLNFDAIARIRPIPGRTAIDVWEHALREVELLPEGARPRATHSMFDAVDPRGQELLSDIMIDTHVDYQFNLAGLPLIGPGAKVGLVLSPQGAPTAMQYAMRELEPIGETQIISVEEAARRCKQLYPRLAPLVSPRLIYFAPSLNLRSVEKIVPCYQCGGEAVVDGELVSLLHTIIPATDDPELAPQVSLQADAQGAMVSAAASVEGGSPPYAFQWLSSSVDLGAVPSDASTVDYEAESRNGNTTERVRVIVTDANGVQVQAEQVLEVDPRSTPIVFVPAVGGVSDYGTERAVSNMGAQQQTGFNNRFTSAGVTRRFNWTGLGAWERDFKEGATGLDHLYADNADIVFYIGHGYGGGFTFESNHDDGTLYYTDAAGAWGDIDLEWMTILSCQVLKDEYDGKKWWQRWGPSFAGMHLLLGFETNAHDWPAFGGTFADWVLGRHIGPLTLAPQPVRSSWFLAKMQEQPDANVAVAMGVIGPAGSSNYNDHFWGKGPVGPDIRGGNIHGYWRVRYQ